VHHYLLFPGIAVIILSVNDKIHNKPAMIPVCQPLPLGSNPNQYTPLQYQYDGSGIILYGDASPSQNIDGDATVRNQK